MSSTMIGVSTPEIYKSSVIPSHFLPIQGLPPQPPPLLRPLRFIFHTNQLQWTPPNSAKNSSWPSRACLAPCPSSLTHGASNKSHYTHPPCLPNSLLRAKLRYASPPAKPAKGVLVDLLRSLAGYSQNRAIRTIRR